MNPLAGTWNASLEKSHRHANHQFHSATLTIAVAGDEVTLTHAGVNLSGKQETGTNKLHSDGQAHPIPQAPAITVRSSWAGTHTLTTEATRDGAAIGSGTYSVSPDGQTLTATVAGIDAAGKHFEQVIVFDRQGDR